MTGGLKSCPWMMKIARRSGGVHGAADAWQKRNGGAPAAVGAWQRADVAVLGGAPVCVRAAHRASVSRLRLGFSFNREAPSRSS